MRKPSPIFFVVLLLLSMSLFNGCHKYDTEQLYEAFKEPSSEYRPFVRWWWNGDKVEADELVRELRLLKEAGIGGVEINPVAFPSYCDSVGKKSLQWLSPEWIDMLKVCFDEAKNLDMTCDLIVGSGWPFGAEYLQGDEQAQIVVNYGEPVAGPATLTIHRDSLIKQAMPKISSPYQGSTQEIMALRLYPNPASNPFDRIDLPVDSLMTIEVPEGSYTLSALVKINGFMEVINGAPGAAGPVLNHFNTEAVNKYLHTMSDSIQGRIGPLKNHIRALFTDSMELEGANWSSDMAETFQQRYGYNITDYLPFILFKIGSMGSAINYNPVVPVTPEFQELVERARFDFEDFKARLIMERFTEPYIAWCHELGVKARAQAYGRGFYPLENAMGYDIPEGESWTTNWLKHKPGEEMSETDYRRGRAYTMVNKFVSSAAHLAGNRMVSCEEMTNTYTVFNMTLEQLKLGGDQTAISGVTHSVFHGFNYSPNQEVPFPGWVRYGAYYSENNTWWPYLHYYTEYKGRLSTALQHGTYYADIAILNPENDMWSTIGMQNEPFPNVTRAPYKTMVWEAINKCGGGVDYVTENILNEGQMRRGVFHYNERSYNTLILIDVERMHPETSEQLQRFVEQGGKLIYIDTIPYKSLGMRNGEALNEVNSEFGTAKPSTKLMRNVPAGVFVKPPKEGFIAWYDSLMRAEHIPHYLEIERPDPYVMQNRYTTDDGCEMIFLCNTHRYQAHQTRITFSRDMIRGKHAWIWDLQTGERSPLLLNEDGSYDFDLGPVESMLIVFDHHRPSSHHVEIRHDTTLKLAGGWDVELVHARLDTVVKTHFDTLFDLKDHPDYQHFAGTIIYRKTINYCGDVTGCVTPWLDLGRVDGVSELFVNGQSAGVKYYGRRLYDLDGLLHEGENELEVHVVTTLGNYMKTFTREENPTAWVYLNRKNHEQPLQSMGMRLKVKG